MDVLTIRQRLLARAFLYDDPGCYSAGVDDALTAMTIQRPTTDLSPPPAGPSDEERRAEREAVLRRSA